MSYLCKCASGVVLVCLSVLLVGIGIVLHFLIPTLIVKGLHAQTMINPDNPATYDVWVSSYNQSIALYRKFYFWNITNPEDVMYKGHKPRLVQVGPYMYRKYRRRFNIEFSDDLGLVTYNKMEFYTLEAANSTGDPNTDVITGINPIYMGVMQQVGGERNLLKNMAGGVMQQIIGLFSTQLTAQVIHGWRPLVLLWQIAKCVVIHRSIDDAYIIWSNSLTPPDTCFENMVISEGYSTPANIMLDTLRKLWNPLVDKSLLNPYPSSSRLWDHAASGNETAVEQLLTSFSLSREQLTRILMWIPKFEDYYVIPYLMTLHHGEITSLDDLSYLQWGLGRATPLWDSVCDEGQDLPGYPEIHFFAKRILKRSDNAVNFDVALSKSLLNGSVPLFEKQNVLKYLELYDQTPPRCDTIKEIWGLDKDRCEVLGAYIHYLMETFANFTLQQSFKDPRMGLIVSRTVSEWLFNYTDPFLMLLQQPEQAKLASLFINDTSPEQAMSRLGVETVNTGRYNTTQIANIVAWNGTCSIDIWASPEKVGGTNGEQFAPGMNVPEDLSDFGEVFEYHNSSSAGKMAMVWFDDTLRQAHLQPSGLVWIKGIRLRRYQSILSVPNPKFYQLYLGLANMSLARGAPVFISKPNFSGCDSSWAGKVEGTHPVSSEDNTWIDVEPISGISMNARKRVQVNIYIPPDEQFDWLNVYYKNAPRDIMIPLLWVEELATIPDALAEQFKSQVYTALDIRLYGFIVTMGIGIACCVLALVLLISAASQRWKQDYRSIQ